MSGQPSLWVQEVAGRPDGLLVTRFFDSSGVGEMYNGDKIEVPVIPPHGIENRAGETVIIPQMGGRRWNGRFVFPLLRKKQE